MWYLQKGNHVFINAMPWVNALLEGKNRPIYNLPNVVKTKTRTNS